LKDEKVREAVQVIVKEMPGERKEAFLSRFDFDLVHETNWIEAARRSKADSEIDYRIEGGIQFLNDIEAKLDPYYAEQIEKVRAKLEAKRKTVVRK
jgi:hypothetical protein